MIRDRNINEDILTKAITAQRFVLDNSQYATVVIRDYSKYSILCHGDQNITSNSDDYLDAVAYNSKEDCFKLCKYNGRKNNIDNDRDIQIKPNKYDSRYNLEWKKKGITKDTDDANSDNIRYLLELINTSENIINLDNVLTKITIWDDGTYRITIYKPSPERKPIIECDSWYRIRYKWSDNKMVKYYVDGKLLNNLQENKEKIREYDIDKNVDYIEEFNNRECLWLGVTSTHQ